MCVYWTACLNNIWDKQQIERHLTNTKLAINNHSECHFVKPKLKLNIALYRYVMKRASDMVDNLQVCMSTLNVIKTSKHLHQKFDTQHIPHLPHPSNPYSMQK